MGLFLSALCFLIGRHGIHLLSSSADVLKNSSDYLSIYSFYLIPFSITAIVNSAFRAVGNARIPLVIVAITTVINITGDYLTVICNWPIPGLGIRGVALSGLTASSFGSMLALAFLSRSILKDSFSKILPIDFNQLKTIIKIGFPSGLQRLLWALSVFMLFYILRYSDHPTEAIASWTIGMRVEGLVFMPLMALSLAVSSIVGQNLGAKQPERAFKAGWQVTKIGLGLMLVLGSAMFFLSNRLAHQMSIDPFTITYTSNYLRINAFSEPFLAFGMIMAGALQGAGDTRTPMWISLATHWMIRMPVAALLVIGLKVGPTGAWIAMALSIVLMGLLTLWRYQSKAWITTEV
jgi:putative MATE family efflux protein